jgi:hypothetical protein
MINALAPEFKTRTHLASWLVSVLAGLAILLAGCDRGKVEKLESENTKLKGELETVQEQVKQLAAIQKAGTEAREREEAKRKQEAAEREQVEAKRKQELAEQEEKTKRDQEAKKAEAIDKCFDKIELRMKALLDTPNDLSSFQEFDAMNATVKRIESVANSKKEEIGEILIELKHLEFPSVSELERAVERFIRDYNNWASATRFYYQYGILREREKAKKELEESSQYHKAALGGVAKIKEIRSAAESSPIPK